MYASGSSPSPVTPSPQSRARDAVLDAARLAAVRQSGLLDSEVEESLDALTRLAVRLARVPVSFISIVDAERDFYKSQCGFPAAIAETRQLKGETFCHYTLEREDPLVIRDTLEDPLWRQVPTVESLGIRAYVGFPLRVGGQNIGSLCVVDMQPRDWSADELEVLQELARSVVRELELRAALAASRAAVEQARVMALSREEIIAVLAHDLRTPLQILHLSATLMQRESDERHQALAGRMLSAVDLMRNMAGQLLSATGASVPGLRQAIASRSLAADAVGMMAPMAERSAHGLRLGPVDEAVLLVDYGQLLRVLGNLIGNALKYSPEGGEIVVAGSRSGAVFSLTVTDRGVGMDSQELAQAFDRGWQGGPGKARGDGAGLGLSIVQALVAENEGWVGIASTKGAGTTVTVSLPCR